MAVIVRADSYLKKGPMSSSRAKLLDSTNRRHFIGGSDARIIMG
jgi:hypothetical protein